MMQGRNADFKLPTSSNKAAAEASAMDGDGSETNNSKQQQLNRFLSSKYHALVLIEQATDQ
jgi:hypothetical protein